MVPTPVEMPGRRAKMVCNLGTPEEQIVSEAQEFSFAVRPEFKFTMVKITDESVTLDFVPPGETEKKTATLKILTPP